MNIKYQFEYGFSIKAFLKYIIALGLVMSFIYILHSTNENGFRNFTKEQETIFYYVLMGILSLVIVMYVVSFINSITMGKTYLLITDKGFILPKALFRGEVKVPFEQIQNVGGTGNKYFKGIKVSFRNTNITILADLFPIPGEFNQFILTLRNELVQRRKVS